MARQPTPGRRSKVLPGDEVILRAVVTRVAEGDDGEDQVTVEVYGWSKSRITLPADRVEKA